MTNDYLLLTEKFIWSKYKDSTRTLIQHGNNTNTQKETLSKHNGNKQFSNKWL
jgi:hypothetical protein